MSLKAPFPWFGGKSRVAHLVWERFGDIRNYVEPFFGSGAVLLARPNVDLDNLPLETVNDIDGFVANAWRSIAHAPDVVAEWADYPPVENDLHARHIWLRAQTETLVARLEGDPDFYDAKIAGWWLWGMAQWIGGGFCGDSGSGPWVVEDGRLVNGAKRRGVLRRMLHLGSTGQGVSRRRLHLGSTGQDVSRKAQLLYEYMDALSQRMRRVRVCSGDWSRICGPTPTFMQGLTGVFLDPPYGDDAKRDMNIYAQDSGTVAKDVLKWCIENGDNPLLRIALCGYDGEHNDLEDFGWGVSAWSAHGGYANQGVKQNGNKHRERIWFSPHCLSPTPETPSASLFDNHIAETGKMVE